MEPKLKKLYAALTDDGIFAIQQEGQWYPLVFTEKYKIVTAIKHLQAYSDFAKVEITLAEFSDRKDIMVIKPDEKK